MAKKKLNPNEAGYWDTFDKQNLDKFTSFIRNPDALIRLSKKDPATAKKLLTDYITATTRTPETDAALVNNFRKATRGRLWGNPYMSRADELRRLASSFDHSPIDMSGSSGWASMDEDQKAVNLNLVPYMGKPFIDADKRKTPRMSGGAYFTDRDVANGLVKPMVAREYDINVGNVFDGDTKHEAFRKDYNDAIRQVRQQQWQKFKDRFGLDTAYNNTANFLNKSKNFLYNHRGDAAGIGIGGAVGAGAGSYIGYNWDKTGKNRARNTAIGGTIGGILGGIGGFALNRGSQWFYNKYFGGAPAPKPVDTSDSGSSYPPPIPDDYNPDDYTSDSGSSYPPPIPDDYNPDDYTSDSGSGRPDPFNPGGGGDAGDVHKLTPDAVDDILDSSDIFDSMHAVDTAVGDDSDSSYDSDLDDVLYGSVDDSILGSDDASGVDLTPAPSADTDEVTPATVSSTSDGRRKRPGPPEEQKFVNQPQEVKDRIEAASLEGTIEQTTDDDGNICYVVHGTDEGDKYYDYLGNRIGVGTDVAPTDVADPTFEEAAPVASDVLNAGAAPVKAKPVTPAPGKPAPVKPTPVKPTPVKPIPVTPAPGKPIPVNPAAVPPPDKETWYNLGKRQSNGEHAGEYLFNLDGVPYYQPSKFKTKAEYLTWADKIRKSVEHQNALKALSGGGDTPPSVPPKRPASPVAPSGPPKPTIVPTPSVEQKKIDTLLSANLQDNPDPIINKIGDLLQQRGSLANKFYAIFDRFDASDQPYTLNDIINHPSLREGERQSIINVIRDAMLGYFPTGGSKKPNHNRNTFKYSSLNKSAVKRFIINKLLDYIYNI